MGDAMSNPSSELAGKTIELVEPMATWGGWRMVFRDGSQAEFAGEYSGEDMVLRIFDSDGEREVSSSEARP
jgi:hypothetical protein